jgi:capsular exopolysaccharide synthesis family protein
LTPHDYVRILLRGWIWVAASVLAFVAAAAAIVYSETPTYRSTTQLFVTTPFSRDAFSGAYEGNLYTQQRVASYVDVARSYVLAEQVVESADLDIDPSELQSRVEAEVIPETVLLSIGVTATSPTVAQSIASTYADEFISLVGDIERAPTSGDSLVTATVLNPASLPDSPFAPKPMVTLGLAGFLGLLVGVGLVALRELFRTSITGADELQAVTSASALGSIDYYPGASKHPLIIEAGPRSPQAEALRLLRANLQFVNVDSVQKAIVVTSSLPGEGKSTVATNLAMSLAETGVRVTLLDADLRKPSVADFLGIPSDVGLTNVLVGELDIEQAAQTYGKHGLTVIASGPKPPNPAELLQSQVMADVLGKLRESADVVLIDAPPVLPVVDAAILTSMTDGAILVVRNGRTRRDQVRHAVAALDKVGGRLLGTVLNMVPQRRFGSRTLGYYGDPEGAKPRRKAAKSGRPKSRRNGTRTRVAPPANEPSPVP